VLNDDGLPRLRISSLYREVLAKGNPAPKDTKEYVGDKVRSAMWLDQVDPPAPAHDLQR
jgi:RNA polymerase sigma-54 factor